MPDILAAALETEGLLWLALAVAVAGIVRGFSGFGSAMIIMPVAASVLSPVEAVICLVAAEILGPVPNLRTAWRAGDPGDVARLLMGAFLALPVGIWFLSRVEPEVFGWIISALVICMLILVISGWRYRGRLTRRLTLVTGGVGGFMTGFAAIPGPPVIMLYMASQLPAATVRANLMLYLFGIDLLLFPVLWVLGHMIWPAFALGLLLGLLNAAGNVIGGWLFDPKAERLFRAVAYLVIVTSAILGLPLWKEG